MAAEWGAAILAAGAVGSASAGVWALWRFGPAARRLRRRVSHERLRMPLLGRDTGRRLRQFLPPAVGAVVLYLLVSTLTQAPVLSFFVSFLGFMVPGWVQEWQDTRRLVTLGEQLNAVMAMVATSLRRGTPLEVALAEAVRTMPYPLGPTLQNLVAAMGMGVTLGHAVEQVRKLPAVSGSTDFQVFATEMVICHERGANVIQAFETLRQVLAARRKYRDQVREQMGQHLLQALVIVGIGALVLLAYAGMTDDGLGPLLDSFAGQLILAASILGNVFLVRWTHLSLLRQIKKM